jgi:hypothetical protein
MHFTASFYFFLFFFRRFLVSLHASSKLV